VIHQGTIIDLQAAHAASEAQGPFPDSMVAILSLGETGLQMAGQALSYALEKDFVRYDRKDVTLLPPVPRPGKVMALGKNYAAHAAEGGSKPPDYPMIFHKTATSLIGDGASIQVPPVVLQPDFEAELAIVIGRNGRDISEQDALDYVAGYCPANDVTARDWQRRTSQFSIGKMVDSFGPLGPALVTSDEIPDPGSLQIQSRLNGKVMQDSNTRYMIFSVPFIISYLSQVVTLEVGDVILTGTPEGVGFARTPPVWLQDGDEIVVEIEGLGALTNRVVRDQS
jgi:2-keto-4-pentenoate hydratase/2-oxohepta-3-ene-1,7-dioic acid hydratase in catechol pathway